jgi:hypothetical protein
MVSRPKLLLCCQKYRVHVSTPLTHAASAAARMMTQRLVTRYRDTMHGRQESLLERTRPGDGHGYGRSRAHCMPVPPWCSRVHGLCSVGRWPRTCCSLLTRSPFPLSPFAMIEYPMKATPNFFFSACMFRCFFCAEVHPVP